METTSLSEFDTQLLKLLEADEEFWEHLEELELWYGESHEWDNPIRLL